MAPTQYTVEVVAKKPRSIDCSLWQGSDYSDEELEFLKAIDRRRRMNFGGNLDCRDVLEVAHELGYTRKDATGKDS